jgi:hypothetical protein
VLAGLNEEERLSYGLSKKTYNYLGLSTDDGEDESILDYAAFFTQVRRALANLGFSEGEASIVLRTIVAILNLGEVEFETDAAGDVAVSEMPVRDPAVGEGGHGAQPRPARRPPPFPFSPHPVMHTSPFAHTRRHLHSRTR